MLKKAISAILTMAFVVTLILSAAPQAMATVGVGSAEKLYALGLFQGVGDNADGTPNFALDRVPTRHEGVTMLVRLLGYENVVRNDNWAMPFTDVAEWAKPYVGFAYMSRLTTGTSATTFGGTDTITASQYITFVLRALGYESGKDFEWDKAWELSDKLGFTNGEYNASSKEFTRGDVAVISFNALSAIHKETGGSLFEILIENGAITQAAADYAGLKRTGYFFDKTTGLLTWRGGPDDAEKLVADFSGELPGWDVVGMSVTATANGNGVVRILNGHGEPHLWTDSHYIYVADGDVVAQTCVTDSISLYQPFNGVSPDGARVILGDGKTATVYDDQTLQVIAVYDLQALCAGLSDDIPIWHQNTEYDITAYGDGYLLLRGSYNQLHIVVYPGSGRVDVVYKELFAPDDLEYFEGRNAEGPMRFDSPHTLFIYEREGILHFSCNLSNVSGGDLEYEYQLKE